MVEIIEICRLYEFEGLPLIDVRSPSEYNHAHIPGAVNIPLFDDDERAMVGTRYTQAGKEAGFMLGLEIAGPKLPQYVKKLNALCHVHSPLIIYCWRGGMRSNAMAWLFSQAGHDVKVVNGGYKAYRGFVREQITDGWDFRIIGGMTGAGKTEVLLNLQNAGLQVIDLEALACHKGSVFGHLGQKEQPNNEWFENILWEKLRRLDRNKPVLIEDESRSIGRVSLPESFYMKMQHSQLFLLQVNISHRTKRLIDDYGRYSREQLIENIDKLQGYLGGEIHKKAVGFVEGGDLGAAVELLLKYYDNKYTDSITRYRPAGLITPVEGGGDSSLNAQKITVLI